MDHHEQLLDKLRAGTRQTHEVNFRALTVNLRVLSNDEVMSIKMQAVNEAKRLGWDALEGVAVLMQRYTLKLASTGPDKVPVLNDKFLSALSTDEMIGLYQEYIRIMDSVNPNIETIPNDEFRALVEALKKNMVSPTDCNLRQLRAICTAFRELILKLEEQESLAASSSGGPPSQSATAN